MKDFSYLPPKLLFLLLFKMLNFAGQRNFNRERRTKNFWIRICMKQHVLNKFLNFPTGSWMNMAKRRCRLIACFPFFIANDYKDAVKASFTTHVWKVHFTFTLSINVHKKTFHKLRFFYDLEVKLIINRSCFWHSIKFNVDCGWMMDNAMRRGVECLTKTAF